MNLKQLYIGWNYCNVRMNPLDKMLHVLAAIADCDVSDLKGNNRKRTLVEVRAAFFILTEIYFGEKYSLNKIAATLKKKHATVLYHRKESIHIKEVKKIITKYHQFINNNYGPHNPKTQTTLLSNDRRRLRTNGKTARLFSQSNS